MKEKNGTMSFVMTYLRYKLGADKVERYNRAFIRIEGRLKHESHRTRFHGTFHLYQAYRKGCDIAVWLNYYMEWAEYNTWDDDKIMQDLKVMVDCLGFYVYYIHEIGEYICQD